MNEALHLTPAAAAKIRELIEEDGNLDLKFRVYVIGGGCSGFQYGVSFEEEMQADDTVISDQKVQILIDPMSFPYLQGTNIDYKTDLEGERFVFVNPNAKTTCGCGSSFSAD